MSVSTNNKVEVNKDQTNFLHLCKDLFKFIKRKIIKNYICQDFPDSPIPIPNPWSYIHPEEQLTQEDKALNIFKDSTFLPLVQKCYEALENVITRLDENRKKVEIIKINADMDEKKVKLLNDLNSHLNQYFNNGENNRTLRIVATEGQTVEINNSGNLVQRIAVENMNLSNKSTLVPILVKTQDEATSKNYYLRILRQSDDTSLDKVFGNELLSNPDIDAILDELDDTHYDLYLENESNKTKSLIKDHENEIAGFPNDTEEIKKEPVELNNQENQEDAFLENFQKTTTEFDNSYAIKLPKGMNNTGYKIDYSKIDVYKFLEALLGLIKIHKEMNKNNNTKKIKFNSLKELHQYIDKNFVLNDK